MHKGEIDIDIFSRIFCDWYCLVYKFSAMDLIVDDILDIYQTETLLTCVLQSSPVTLRGP